MIDDDTTHTYPNNSDKRARKHAKAARAYLSMIVEHENRLDHRAKRAGLDASGWKKTSCECEGVRGGGGGGGAPKTSIASSTNKAECENLRPTTCNKSTHNMIGLHARVHSV